jgi:hypothetical protein
MSRTHDPVSRLGDGLRGRFDHNPASIQGGVSWSGLQETSVSVNSGKALWRRRGTPLASLLTPQTSRGPPPCAPVWRVLSSGAVRRGVVMVPTSSPMRWPRSSHCRRNGLTRGTHATGSGDEPPMHPLFLRAPNGVSRGPLQASSGRDSMAAREHNVSRREGEAP